MIKFHLKGCAVRKLWAKTLKKGKRSVSITNELKTFIQPTWDCLLDSNKRTKRELRRQWFLQCDLMLLMCPYFNWNHLQEKPSFEKCFFEAKQKPDKAERCFKYHENPQCTTASLMWQTIFSKDDDTNISHLISSHTVTMTDLYQNEESVFSPLDSEWAWITARVKSVTSEAVF